MQSGRGRGSGHVVGKPMINTSSTPQQASAPFGMGMIGDPMMAGMPLMPPPEMMASMMGMPMLGPMGEANDADS